MWWTDRVRAHARTLACAGASGLTLAGCASGARPVPAPAGFVKDAKTPLGQYAIQLDRSPDVVALSVHAGGVSAAQRDALARFVEQWRGAGGVEAVVVQAPVNSTEPANPALAARAVAATLSGLGVPPSRLRVADYDAGGAPGAPVLARFERYQARGPDCTEGWGDLTATGRNTVSSHFGCAHAANLAAMVADPRDLERPSAVTPADGLRRAVVLDKYRQGAITSSAKDDQATGNASEVGR